MYYERTTVQQRVRALILHFFPPRFRWGGTSTTSSLIRFSLSGSAITKKTDVYSKEVLIVYRLLIHTALKHIEWNKSCTSEVFTMLCGSFSNYVIHWTGFTLLTAEIIKWQKCAHMGLNGFHKKCIIGTHCNWKNQNPVSPLGATS